MWPFLIAGGIQLIGSLVQGAAAAARGRYAQQQANFSADIAERASQDAYVRAGVRQMQENAKGAAVVAAERTEQAGTGADVNVGSNLQVQLQTQAFTEMTKEIIKNDAWREALGLHYQAQRERQEGAYAELAGEQEQKGALIGGLGKLAGILGPKVLDTNVDWGNWSGTPSGEFDSSTGMTAGLVG